MRSRHSIRTENMGHESAFPCHDECAGDLCFIHAHYGLSKRDLFAAMAMQGFCADKHFDIGGGGVPSETRRILLKLAAQEVAEASALFANALLAELSKEIPLEDLPQ